ncbi:MAG TPA: hypothetical protein VF787_23005 [Thermoanaerobaculia bacterium]
MLRRRPAGLLVLALLASVSLVAATPVLNPRVTRSAQPHGFVPSDCNESVAVASMPRVDVAQIPMPQFAALDLAAPPTGDLRTTLRDTQDALRRNDRPAFDAGLARAKALVASYPAGAERRGAEELVRTYEDAASVWDAQFNAPFFDQSSPVYARLSAYPGWNDAVRRSVLMDDRDRTFYPAGESRTFLTNIAADRLGRLGIRARETLRPRTESSPRVTAPTTTSKTTPKTTSKTTPKTTPKTTKTTSARPASRRRTAPVSPDPPARRTPRVAATPAPVAPPPAATKAAAPPAAGGSSTTTVAPATTPTTTVATETAATVTTATEPVVATDTGVTTDTTLTTVATDTTITTDTTATTVTEAAPEPTQQTRSVVLPVILILIGLGVLIVLFRASK